MDWIYVFSNPNAISVSSTKLYQFKIKLLSCLCSLSAYTPNKEMHLTFSSTFFSYFSIIIWQCRTHCFHWFSIFQMHNLSKIGGKTVESATRKIWSRLCTTELASTICWTGANGKYCLKPLTLNRLVRGKLEIFLFADIHSTSISKTSWRLFVLFFFQDAVLVTHPRGKESEIQRATMLWFSHAQDRLRARKSI